MLDEELFAQLSDEARVVICNICPDASFDEAIAVLASMAEFESEPPTIDEFLDNPYYLGHIGPSIYDFWREELRVIHPSPYYSKFNLVIISGSIGGGKSWASIVSLLYELCVFLHRRDAHEHFGFTDGQQLYVGLCNATMTLSKDTQLKTFFNMFSNSPFFKEQQKKQALVKEPSKSLLALNLPYNIDMRQGSTAQAFIGQAIINVLISELNAMTRQGGQQASNVISELESRLFTRFDRGRMLPRPGKIYLDSSKKETTGSLDGYIDKKRTDTRVRIIEAPFWEFTKNSERDHNTSGKFFKVFKGSRTEDPRILSDDEPDDADVPESLILDVPVEMKEFFEVDIVNSLRDLGGVATWATGNFITSAKAIAEALTLPQSSSKEVISLDMYNDEDRLMNYVDLSNMDKNAVYFIGADLSKNKDRTGLCALRVSGKKELARFDREEGLRKMLQENTYSADLVLCLKNKPNQQIPIYKIEAFIYDLIYAGYKIGGVSFDQAFSTDLLQRLLHKQVNAQHISVDRPRDRYDTFRMTIMEGRIKISTHPGTENRVPIIEKELKELIDKGDKIDHPDETEHNKGEWIRPSKDVSDAICNALWNCLSQSTGHSVAAVALESYIDALDQFAAQPDPVYDALMRGGFNNKLPPTFR